ncbi:MAG TPA: NUDIX domain-containing protein [Candidatus Didemnitutus sp.]|nr:NUDIX domain-containing protein [Candidatus Didemnitutus sp.]
MGQNPNELFDIVDDQDRVIGQAPRGIVHAQNLWHRAVHVIVFNRAGRVFLQKRSMSKDQAPGLWDSSCAGHLDAGEDYDHAAWRELQEELGVKLPAPPSRWMHFRPCEDTGWEFCWIYRIEHEGPFVLHPEEIERGEWVEPRDLTNQIAADPKNYCTAFRMIWREAIREKRQPGSSAR